MFAVGIAIFTAASAVAALAPSIAVLDAARAIQGLGGALVTPLTEARLPIAGPVLRFSAS
jgi:MFS family permease